MALSLRHFVRKLPRATLKSHSTHAETVQVIQEPIQTFRTNEDNPMKHNNEHLNRFYVIPSSITDTLFRNNGLPLRFKNQIKTFGETAIMIREPAIDVISHLQLTDYTRPVNKYVIYGEIGSGKTITLAHILHYGYLTKHLLMHVPWVPNWFRLWREVSPSQSHEGYYDSPINGAAWLIHFKHQNFALLSELDLRLSKDYIWNIQERNLADSPLLALIDFGIARAKFACDVIDILINEIKLASTAGKCRTLVVIDGFNSFFHDDCILKGTDFKFLKPQQITLTNSFINLTKYDWCNAAVVVTVDEIAIQPEKRNSKFPRYLLGKEGFEHLDPFLPVEVPAYSSDEFEAMMNYYKDRKWIRNISAAGQRELELLSNRNPYKLMCYSAPL